MVFEAVHTIMGEPEFADRHWESADGLQLHYRDYAELSEGSGASDRPPILCIPGLTRNARDFEPVAEAFAGQWRVIATELRGRGESEYAKNSDSYNPMQYVADIAALLEAEKLEKVVLFGTSLGGLVAMLLTQAMPDKVAGVMLNDIGPDIEEEGLDRIREYVGHGRSFPTWMHAAWSLKETSGQAYPGYSISDWLKLAKRLMCVGGNGRITYDYDMRIAEPFAAADNDPREFDMWPVFEAMAGRPCLALRGELSDILSAATLRKMAKRVPDLQAVTVQHVGHAPCLDEPASLDAMAQLLAKVAAP